MVTQWPVFVELSAHVYLYNCKAFWHIFEYWLKFLIRTLFAIRRDIYCANSCHGDEVMVCLLGLPANRLDTRCSEALLIITHDREIRVDIVDLIVCFFSPFNGPVRLISLRPLGNLIGITYLHSSLSCLWFKSYDVTYQHCHHITNQARNEFPYWGFI